MPADTAISSPSYARRPSPSLRWAGLSLVLLLAACGGGLVPVHNIRNAPVMPARGQTPSVQGVRDAILRALASRDWQIAREGVDGIVATLVAKNNAATVLIQFDAQSYSISYLDSSPGLRFDGAYIHRRYNDWIERLDKTIRKLVATAEGEYEPAPGLPPTAPPAEAPPPAAAAPGEPAPELAPPPAPPPEGAPAVAPYEAPPPPPPAPKPRR
jgi:hypothetical protein